MYNEVANSGDVVIQKRGISIVDTHGSAIATLLCHVPEIEPYRSRIFPVGRHQEVRRFVSSGYITSRQSVVIEGCRTMKDIRRLGSVRFF